IEPNNGQRDPKPKRHTAKLCRARTRQAIVNALASGDSKRAIARQLGVSNNTVTAVAAQEWEQVAARKYRIAGQAERAATRAFDELNQRLDAPNQISTQLLIPIAGMSVDKMLSLRGDSALTIRHEHTHRLTDEDIIAFAVARAQKPAREHVVEAEALPKTH